MKNSLKAYLSAMTKEKISSAILVAAMITSIIQPFSWASATVIDGGWNTLSGANSNFVNLSNSGAYPVDFSLSGTLDTGNTLLIVAEDGSGKTATGSFVSASGTESTGSVLLNFSGTGWTEWLLSFSGTVYSGSTATPVIASGMTLTGVLDTVRPSITLSTSAPSTITGAVSVQITLTEPTITLTESDITPSNAATSAFSQLSSTGYAFTLTPTVSTGTVTASVGSGTFSDLAGNPNTVSNVLSFSKINSDITAPIISIVSPLDNATVSGNPTISGTVSDSGGIAGVTVNGGAATLGSGTWSKVLFGLAGGANTITAIATDTSGNTGSTSITVNRVSLASDIKSTLSGATSAGVSFSTDLTATGILIFGTSPTLVGATTLTGTSAGSTHSFSITGLVPDTVYYFQVQGQGGIPSSILQFKTPASIDTNTASGAITATSAVYLSGSTSTGAVFLNTGSLSILSLTSSGASLSIPLDGLTITASGNNWDGVLQAPEITSTPTGLVFSGYSLTGSIYQIGNSRSELTFSGQNATVTVKLASSLSGQTVTVFRSVDQWATYNVFTTCLINSTGDCAFSTSQLSLFAFTLPADTTPNAFSFTAVTNAELSQSYSSNPITVSGIDAPATISITGGEYSINGAPFSAAAGAVNSGDSIVVRSTSSSSNSTSVNAVVTIGGVSGTFTITTKARSSSGGSGGGSSIIRPDYCPGGDTSPSYYDRLCSGDSGINAGTGWNVVTGALTGSLNIPPIIIHSLDGINFRDVRGNWAESYILRLVIRGIIDNVEFYRPNANLTRAEFLKIVINTTGWNVPTTNLDIPFNDVDEGIWYAPYVSLAVSKWMISGTRPSFHPNYAITRAEAMKILINALGVTVKEPVATNFADVNYSSDLAKYVEAAKFLGIVTGQIIDGQWKFRPNDPITRAEIAKVVVKSFGL